MKKNIFFAAGLVLAAATIAAVSVSPIKFGVLLSELNANQNSITNVGAIVFSDGTSQTTASVGGGGSNGVNVTHGSYTIAATNAGVVTVDVDTNAIKTVKVNSAAAADTATSAASATTATTAASAGDITGTALTKATNAAAAYMGLFAPTGTVATAALATTLSTTASNGIYSRALIDGSNAAWNLVIHSTNDLSVLAASNNIVLTPAGNTLFISATASGSVSNNQVLPGNPSTPGTFTAGKISAVVDGNLTQGHSATNLSLISAGSGKLVFDGNLANLYDPAGAMILDGAARLLKDQNETNSVDLYTRTLSDSNGIVRFNWNEGEWKDTGGATIVDMINGLWNDSDYNPVVDVEAHVFHGRADTASIVTGSATLTNGTIDLTNSSVLFRGTNSMQPGWDLFSVNYVGQWTVKNHDISPTMTMIQGDQTGPIQIWQIENGPVVGQVGPSGFEGSGASITNLIHSSTVSAGSGVTVTPTQNADGSTNYAVSSSAAGTGATTNSVTIQTSVSTATSNNAPNLQAAIDAVAGGANTNIAYNSIIQLPPHGLRFTNAPKNFETNELAVIGIPHKASVTGGGIPTWSTLVLKGNNKQGYGSGSTSAGLFPVAGTALYADNTNAGTFFKSIGWETNISFQWNLTSFHLEDLTLVITNGSYLSGIDFSAFANNYVKDVSIVHTTSGSDLPTPAPGTFGIKGSYMDNDNLNRVENVNIEGFAVGMTTFEHGWANNVNIANCIEGVRTRTANFPMVFDHLYTANCTTNFNGIGSAIVIIRDWEIENSAASGFRSNAWNYSDGGSNIKGIFNYYLKDNINPANNGRIAVLPGTAKGGVYFNDMSNPGRTFTDPSALSLGFRGPQMISFGNSAIGAGYGWFKMRGDPQHPAAVQNGDFIATPMTWGGYDGATYPGIVAGYCAPRVVGSVSSGNVPTAFSWWVGHNSSAPMVLDLQESKVGIGTTALITNGCNVVSGAITNNGLVWFTLATNDVPAISGPNGSLCTTTNGDLYVMKAGAWVLK